MRCSNLLGGAQTWRPSRGAARPTRAAGAALLLALILVACVAPPSPDTTRAALRDSMQSLIEPLSQQQAIAFIGQPFPASASGVEVMGEAALDTMVVARFKAPRSDVLAYLADLGIPAPLTPGYSPFFSTDPPFAAAAGWWAPPTTADTAGDFSGLYQQVGSKHTKAAVVDAGDGQVTIYLQVYNT